MPIPKPKGAEDYGPTSSDPQNKAIGQDVTRPAGQDNFANFSIDRVVKSPRIAVGRWPLWDCGAIMMSSTLHIVSAVVVALSLFGQAAIRPLLLCGCAASGRACPCHSHGRSADASAGCPCCPAKNSPTACNENCGEDSSPAPCRCTLLPRDEQSLGLVRLGASKPVSEKALEVVATATTEACQCGTPESRLDFRDIPLPRLQCLYCVWRN